MKKTVEFIGYSSGDHECHCWDVKRVDYKRVTGRRADKWDRSYFHKGYRLYMENMFDLPRERGKWRVTIEFEPLPEQEEE